MVTYTSISPEMTSEKELFSLDSEEGTILHGQPESDSSDIDQDFLVDRGIRQRMCVVTRTVLPDTELLRCVARFHEDNAVEIVPDPQRTMPGRGAWIQPNPELFRVAVQRKALQRALKVPATAGIQRVRDYLDALDNPGDETHDE